jgi:predicted metal-binding protein
MAEVTLEWKLQSKNFDTMKQEMIEDGDEHMLRHVENYIGNNHCRLCVLASGPMCIKRSVCRIPENEIWVNVEINEIKEQDEKA